MKIEVVCNTEDEVLFQNVAINSRRDLEWITEVQAHDGHAVIVGGGPSLKNCIETIRWRQSLGQKVFALNGAYEYLFDNGIRADYQVILDARPQNSAFVTTDSNCICLLASQCDKSVFEKAEEFAEVMVWHPKIDGIEDHMPDKRESLTLIGGGTTVGLSAMCLAYTMGYRKMHLFGYDSSHDNGSHAYEQTMNTGEPICKVTMFGKTFRTSWTMAKQAEFFPQLCDQLIDLGCIITVDGDGLLPFMTREIARRAALNPRTEREKYEAMWTMAEYRETAPGEEVAQLFVDIAGIKAGDVVIDFGCGTGRGAKRVHDLTGCEFILVDFAENSLDESVSSDISWHTRVIRDLSMSLDIGAEKGYCTDVMEHIPAGQVDSVITNIMQAAERVFFQISLVDDACGVLIGQPLHLSVHSFDWWKRKFESFGHVIEWAQDRGESALFYISRSE